MVTIGERRTPEIDWLKGFAIICVLFIHARPILDPIVFEHVINRAVPIFIVLFGATSERWWRLQTAAKSTSLHLWYRTRLARLMLPVWGMLVIWWSLALTFPTPQTFRWWHVLATVVGYAPWVGTGWFITMVVELVLVFPAIHVAVKRVGSPVAFLAGIGVMLLTTLNPLPVISFMRWLLWDSAPGDGFYYIWIFFPRYLPHIVAGMAIGSGALRIDTPRSMIAVGLFSGGVLVADRIENPLWAHALLLLLDVPLTLMLLRLFAVFRYMPGPARMLAWLGTHSWGMYLGQMIVHNAVHQLVAWPEVMEVRYRWVYLASLFVGAVGFVVIGNNIRQTRAGDLWSPLSPR